MNLHQFVSIFHVEYLVYTLVFLGNSPSCPNFSCPLVAVVLLKGFLSSMPCFCDFWLLGLV